jgi:pimeloyl-ACP methyl ester carboxylesterase
VSVDEHTVDLASSRVFYRSAPAQISPTPIYIHGVPASADIWVPLLERTGGIALDLPGFGRSDKGGHLDYSVSGLATATVDHMDRIGVQSAALVGHGWGARVAAEVATQRPVGRLILINPIAPEAPWPRAARICRTPGLGELAMGAVTRRGVARLLRRGGPWTDEQLEAVWEQFDQGTQRAILRLHRAPAPPARPSIPTLVLHGEEDPWLGLDHAERIAAEIAHARVETINNASHWPWLEQPDAIVNFIAS